MNKPIVCPTCGQPAAPSKFVPGFACAGCGNVFRPRSDELAEAARSLAWDAAAAVMADALFAQTTGKLPEEPTRDEQTARTFALLLEDEMGRAPEREHLAGAATFFRDVADALERLGQPAGPEAEQSWSAHLADGSGRRWRVEASRDGGAHAARLREDEDVPSARAFTVFGSWSSGELVFDVEPLLTSALRGRGAEIAAHFEREPVTQRKGGS